MTLSFRCSFIFSGFIILTTTGRSKLDPIRTKRNHALITKTNLLRDIEEIIMRSRVSNYLKNDCDGKQGFTKPYTGNGMLVIPVNFCGLKNYKRRGINYVKIKKFARYLDVLASLRMGYKYVFCY
jgi:hypothetical protein